MPNEKAPWSLGKSRVVNVDRKVFAWDPESQSPVFFGMPGTDARYLALFSTSKELRAIMAHIKVEGFTIKQIDDGSGFLDSMPATVEEHVLHIVLDVYVTETGTIRFTQLQRD